MRIARIGTAYDAAEDRIGLAVADADGPGAGRLWLTRRLAERMVPRLAAGLQDDMAPGAAQSRPEAAAAAAPRARASDTLATQVYAQLEARLARKPAEPVRLAENSPQWRVDTVEITRFANGVRRLTFKGEGFEPCELLLSAVELRQWLESLHRAFVRGQWRIDVWPAWLRRNAA